MAISGRLNRFSRRTSLNVRHPRVALISLVAVAFLLVCFVVSVAVGLSLGKRADTLGDSKPYDFSDEPYLSGNKTVKAVDAYAYAFGGDVKAYVARGITDLSICLKGLDGNLSYNSELGGLKDFCENGEKSLSEQMAYIHSEGGYVCAYFYVGSLDIDSPYLRELCISYEAALINEAAASGVDEIMLVGLDPNSENINIVESYLERIMPAAGNCVVGVLISPEIMTLTADDEYVGGRVRAKCDFIALDGRGLLSEPSSDENGGEASNMSGGLDSFVAEMEYYITAYSMRLVLSKENSSLYSAAKDLGIVNIQIIGQ